MASAAYRSATSGWACWVTARASAVAGKSQRRQHLVADRQTPGLPGRQMLTQPMDRAARQFDREMIRGLALHQRGGRQHQFSVALDGPRNVELARVVFATA